MAGPLVSQVKSNKKVRLNDTAGNDFFEVADGDGFPLLRVKSNKKIQAKTTTIERI